MEHRTALAEATKPRTRRAQPKRRPRRRRVRVRVETDDARYEGWLEMVCRPGGLDEVLNDGRAYLALWDATLGGPSPVEEFVAIHKGTIQSVVALEPCEPGPRPAPRS